MCQYFREELRTEDARNVLDLLLKVHFRKQLFNYVFKGIQGQKFFLHTK